MNLIDTLKNELSGDAVNSLSQKLNITPEQTRSGISVAVPAFLAGILNKVRGTGSLGSFGSIFKGNPQSVDAPPETEYGDANFLLSRGSAIVGDLFGGKTDEISNEIAQRTNLTTEKSNSFLTMAAPLIMGHLDRVIANRGWSMPDFVGKLFEEKASIESQLPLGLVSSFGLTGLNLPHLNQTHVVADDINAEAIPTEQANPQNTMGTEEPPSSSSGNILKWIIIIAILGLIAWWFMGRNDTGADGIEYMNDTVTSQSADTMSNRSLAARAGEAISGSLNEAGDWVYNLGADKTITLSDGSTLDVGENSSESKLASFIEDDNQTVSDTTWFSLDRLFFETGSATLKSESQEQLNKIAGIMKSYPNVKLKIGGYTDNTGSAEANMKVSTERANAAMKELVALGISADR